MRLKVNGFENCQRCVAITESYHAELRNFLQSMLQRRSSRSWKEMLYRWAGVPNLYRRCFRTWPVGHRACVHESGGIGNEVINWRNLNQPHVAPSNPSTGGYLATEANA